MRNLCWRLGVVLSSLLASVTTASFAHDDHAPRITRADAIGDLTKNAPVTLFIHGHGFGVGRTPAVKLGDLSTVTQSGSPATPDLTVSSYSTTDIVVTINHPVDSKLMPASYPLRVLTFQKRHGDRGEGDDDDRDAATFDVTIGAVGPKGDKGAMGLPGKGKDGAPGATGPKARGDARPESDVDLLVEFVEVPGFFGYVRLRNRLEEILGRHVDLVMASGLHPRLRERVLREARHVA